MSVEFDNRSNGQFLLNSANQVETVQQYIVGLMRQRRYVPRDIFGVELALEEALTNAIKHGNSYDPAKQVRVTYRVEDAQVWIEVEDEGNGFCMDSVCDPTHPENIPQPGGRGLLFIRSYMTDVQYNDVGNRLTMRKERSDRRANGIEQLHMTDED